MEPISQLRPVGPRAQLEASRPAARGLHDYVEHTVGSASWRSASVRPDSGDVERTREVSLQIYGCSSRRDEASWVLRGAAISAGGLEALADSGGVAGVGRDSALVGWSGEAARLTSCYSSVGGQGLVCTDGMDGASEARDIYSSANAEGW